MAEDGRAEKVTVSMYPVDKAVVRQVQRGLYMNSFSQALQFIVRRYADMKGIEVRGELAKGELVKS